MGACADVVSMGSPYPAARLLFAFRVRPPSLTTLMGRTEIEMLTPLLTALLLSPAALATERSASEPVVHVQGGEIGMGRIVGVVDAPLDVVLDVVLDCDRTDAWFPKLVDTRVVPGDDADTPRCAGSTDLPWPMVDRTWTIEVGAYQETEGERQIWVVPFMYVGGGNLEEMYGGYHLRPHGPDGQQTEITYEAWVDLGTWIPAPLIAWATKRILPGVLSGIESEARLRRSELAMNHH